MKHPELVVMLTYNDYTVSDARRVFDTCRHTKAKYWGFKESPLPLWKMKELSSFMRQCGKKVVLEVPAYSENAGLDGAMKAVECRADYLIGTSFYDSVNKICIAHGIRYMPYVGTVSGRPSVLSGNTDEIIHEAQQYLKKGVYGVNLLGYRYTGDASALIRSVISETADTGVPVCLAGGVDSYQKLDEIRKSSLQLFTIGSAFFDHRFGESFPEQVDRVCGYLNEEPCSEGEDT